MTSPLELEALYDLTTITEVALSPDGDRVAFVADEYDRADDTRYRALYVVPTDGSRDPHLLTRAAGAWSPTWSPDGTRLGVLAERERDLGLRVQSAADDDAEDEPSAQVWVFDLERGGDARQLTDRKDGVRQFDWAPDGKRIVVAARDPTDEEREYLDSREEDGPIVTERLQHKFDGHGWLNTVTTYLFVVDVETHEERRLDDAHGGSGPFEVEVGPSPTWSPDGERIAFLSNRVENPDDSHVLDLYTVRPDGSDLRKLTDSDLTATRPSWSPDGDRLAFVAQDLENWYRPSEVVVAQVAEGSHRSISGNLDRHVEGVTPLRWEDGETIVALITDGGTTRLARFHADGSEPERCFDWQGPTRTVDQFDLRAQTATLLLTHPQDGADLYALDVADLDTDEAAADPTTRLTRVNDEFVERHDLPRNERVWFRNESGDDVEAIVALPADFDEERPEAHPLVVQIHGGPIWYDSPRFSFEDTFWTNSGYVVLHPNYRGSSSYGREFSEVIAGDWGPREVEDVVAGVDELVARGWADPERVFVTGFSYGGITTAWLLAWTDAFAAGAAEHGVYDFTSAFGTDDAQKWAEVDYGLPWENPEVYEGMSSLTDVADVEAPLLLTAGGDDWRCPPTQAEQLYVSLKKRGVPTRLVVYPGENHRRLGGIDEPSIPIHRLGQIEEWFATHDPGEDD